MNEVSAIEIGFALTVVVGLIYVVVICLDHNDKLARLLAKVESMEAQAEMRHMAKSGPKTYKQPLEKNKVILMSDGERARQEADEKKPK